MATRRKSNDRLALFQGTLDLLILRILQTGAQHGQGIARRIDAQSDGVLLVDHGSLYPALQRLEQKGWIAAEWGVSENNRQARFYSLTRTGRKQLERDSSQWRAFAAAMAKIVGH
jgi:transcriptional regulator